MGRRRQPVTSSVGIGLPFSILLPRFVFIVLRLAYLLTGMQQGYALACLSLSLHGAAACITQGLDSGGEVHSYLIEKDIYLVRLSTSIHLLSTFFEFFFNSVNLVF
jgi:hypothetical protein